MDGCDPEKSEMDVRMDRETKRNEEKRGVRQGEKERGVRRSRKGGGKEHLQDKNLKNIYKQFECYRLQH